MMRSARAEGDAARCVAVALDLYVYTVCGQGVWDEGSPFHDDQGVRDGEIVCVADGVEFAFVMDAVDVHVDEGRRSIIFLYYHKSGALDVGDAEGGGDAARQDGFACAQVAVEREEAAATQLGGQFCAEGEHFCFTVYDIFCQNSFTSNRGLTKSP